MYADTACVVNVVAGAVNADSLYVVDVVAGAVYTQMLRVLLSIIK